jgi:8-oxo-dGTP diphosphatase
VDQTPDENTGREQNELAAAIAVFGDRILIVRRSKDEGFLPLNWGVPCGKVEKGELPEHAVVRELKEETGLVAEKVQFVGKSTFKSDWQGRRIDNVQSNYLVLTRIPKRPFRRKARYDKPPRVDLPAKDQAYEWVPAADVKNFGLDDHNLEAICQGLSKTRYSEMVDSGLARS